MERPKIRMSRTFTYKLIAMMEIQLRSCLVEGFFQLMTYTLLNNSGPHKAN